ncbi:LacI family transcriptional regulator [bacterium]|nr:MAG: LacI family transcriptional regulator [bacterium]
MSRPKRRVLEVGRPGRVTMQDIADAAGVHVMTVSNALGNVRGVAPATREKVLRIARELNYIPNSAARALVVGRTGMIAILCTGINEPYYAHMLHYLARHINADGYKITLLRNPGEVTDLVNDTGSVPVDGAIAIDMYHWGDQFRSHPTVPCVAIGPHKHELLDCVLIDMSAGVSRALQLMAKQGRKRIAYVVDAPHLAMPTESRAAAYLEEMEQLGMRPEIVNIYTGHVNTKILPLARQLLTAHFREHGCPDALLCLNDEIAMCAYRVLRDLGRRIPEDALLVGCDGQAHMEYFDPTLSTIAQPIEAMATTAWQFLRQRLAEPTTPLQHATFQGELLVRESLGAVEA